MSRARPRLFPVREFTVAACMAILAGCGGADGNTTAAAAAASDSSSSSSSSTSAPATPTNLAAASGNATASLSWSASSGATTYSVKRSLTSGGPYTQVASVTSVSYTDSTVSNGTAYFYVVSAVNSGGESVNSSQASASPTAPATNPTNPTPAAPGIPAGLTASAGNAQASLTWSATSGATSYHVKRGTANGGPYTQIAAPTSAAYIDKSVTNGTTYYYVVSALNSTGESANSTQVVATPAGSSAPPPATGNWISVTPSSVNLMDNLSCGNYGTKAVQADPTHPGTVYTLFMCQGIWKSTDYGATWSGPINTGSNGATVSDCAGVITVVPTTSTSAPILYEACIRGNGMGLWKSVNGGVDWTALNVAPAGAGTGQQFYAPVADPYDSQHLLMVGHAVNLLIESTDGGANWHAVTTDGGMAMSGGTGGIEFINTGNATTTRSTWLWLAAQAGGVIGTWRTTNSGTNWVKVDKNEHINGQTQIYQPDTSGVVYMAGVYSDLGWGVLKSTDFGQTWAHVGLGQNEAIVFGTPKGIYAMYGWGPGAGQTVDPLLEVGGPSGTGTWTAPGTPVGMSQGPAQAAVLNDGTHNIILVAGYNAGMWRYVEP